MNDDVFDIPLPTAHKKLLLELVKKASTAGVMSLSFMWQTSNSFQYDLEFLINEKENLQYKLSENPIPGFEVLGFMKYNEEKQIIFLTPKLLKWAKYEKQNQVGKFFTRHSLKDFMIALSVILSVSLTILQILGLTLPQIFDIFKNISNP